jgi:hypothetical protein
MNPYPKITELRGELSTEGWTWRQFEPYGRFWLGTDERGQIWLVKMSGKRNAIREHSFSRFAQRLGVNTQSSRYIILGSRAAPLQALRLSRQYQRHQLALWFYPEHKDGICGEGCPLDRLPERDWEAAWLNSGIHNPWDRCLGEILGFLCAQFEPAGQLITTDHWWIQIDNELMFGGWPYERARWSRRAVGYIRDAYAHNFPGSGGRIRNLFTQVSMLTDDDIAGILETPDGYGGGSIASEFHKWYRQARGTAERLLQTERWLG